MRSRGPGPKNCRDAGEKYASRTSEIPRKPLDRFIKVYEALNADRGWWDDPSSLRFSAVAALSCPGEPAAIASANREAGEEIKAASGWSVSLNTPLRFIIGAILISHCDTAAEFLAEAKRVREIFRKADLRRGAVYETMAILVLRIKADGEPITETTIQRFRAVYEEMKRHHWWLTGPDDYPACAILANEPATPEAIGIDTEAIYQAIKRKGFSSGAPLENAANILYLAKLDAERVASRYDALAQGFNANKVAIWQSDFDELAILSFLDHPAETVVNAVLKHREVMTTLNPKPDRSLTFNLAASIAFLDLVQRDHNLNAITDAKALIDMQAIIAAQQVAAASAATAAAVSASS